MDNSSDWPANPPRQHSSLNFQRIRRQARREGRLSTDGSAAWNPFRLTSFESPKRSNTANDVELGHAGIEDGNGNPLTPSTTAPERLYTPIVEERRSKDAEHQSPHQAQDSTTAAESPKTATNGANDGLRSRKPVSEESSPGEEEYEKPKKKKTGFLKHIEPKEPFTLRNQLERTFLNSWINILMLAAPVGIALNYVGIDGKIVFTINFIAIIPLAAMLSFATEEIALRTGETLGGLINATFGNAVELIVAVMALIDNKVAIVQTSLIGSILSNLLLVLGMCFFCGGLNRRVQYFNKTVAQTAASLLALAVASTIVPTVFEENPDFENLPDVAKLSRGTSVILLVVYAAYLFFQLKTHSKVFAEESQKAEVVPWRKKSNEGIHALAQAGGRMGAVHGGGEVRENLINMQPRAEADDEDDGEEPQLHFWVAVATLTISTVIIAFCAEFMVDSIDAITNSSGLTEEFVGLILLPIVGNAAEHATAVTVACKDKMDLAIGVAIGSSMQVSLFLIPLLVIIGWGMGLQDMNLAFDTFQISVLFVAVLLVNYLIGDGESHWLEGMLLMCLYAIIAVCAFFYPNAANRQPSGSGVQVASVLTDLLASG